MCKYFVEPHHLRTTPTKAMMLSINSPALILSMISSVKSAKLTNRLGWLEREGFVSQLRSTEFTQMMKIASAILGVVYVLLFPEVLTTRTTPHLKYIF